LKVCQRYAEYYGNLQERDEEEERMLKECVEVIKAAGGAIG